MMAHAGLCEKPADPKAKAEFDSKLAQMQAERTKQDQMWQTTPTPVYGNTDRFSSEAKQSKTGNPNG
jgi:hypothetical protein